MAVMTIRRLVLDMRRVDGNTTRLLLRSFVDLAIVGELGSTSYRKDLGNGSGKRRLSMIDVTWNLMRFERASTRVIIPIVPMFMCGFDRENCSA